MLVNYNDLFGVVEKKIGCDNPLETDETLQFFMNFVDNFSTGDTSLFEAALIECITVYQKRAFEIGFRTALDLMLGRTT